MVSEWLRRDDLHVIYVRTWNPNRRDVGFMQKNCSPTYRGFGRWLFSGILRNAFSLFSSAVDTFFGYYMACERDYWYHGASGGYPGGANCTTGPPDSAGSWPTDLSNNSGTRILPAAASLNGTYNTKLLADEAARLVMAHDTSSPFYMYLAFMAVHDGCGDSKSGKQAPLQTVETYYNSTVLDTYKVAGAMYTEMDSGIQTVIDALKSKSMWSNTGE